MASTIVTHIILFIAVVGIATGLIAAVKNFSDQSENAFNIKKEELNKQLTTDISIEVVHYDNSTNTTFIYVRNTGTSKMDPEDIDVYLDGERIPRDTSNRTIGVESDTDSVDVGVWNSREELRITVNRHLSDTETHEVIVVTPYTVRSVKSFSI